MDQACVMLAAAEARHETFGLRQEFCAACIYSPNFYFFRVLKSLRLARSSQPWFLLHGGWQLNARLHARIRFGKGRWAKNFLAQSFP